MIDIPLSKIKYIGEMNIPIKFYDEWCCESSQGVKMATQQGRRKPGEFSEAWVLTRERHAFQCLRSRNILFGNLYDSYCLLITLSLFSKKMRICGISKITYNS